MSRIGFVQRLRVLADGSKAAYLIARTWDPKTKKTVERSCGKLTNGSTVQARVSTVGNGISTVVSPRFEIHNCDFRELNIEPNSAALVLTDPPWGSQSNDVWEPLSAFAARVLRPGGLLLAYTGHTYLPMKLHHLEAHLEYVWMSSVDTPGPAKSSHRERVTNGWTPAVLYCKPPLQNVPTPILERQADQQETAEGAVRMAAESPGRAGAGPMVQRPRRSRRRSILWLRYVRARSDRSCTRLRRV